jgi:hypothetical protein
MEPLAMVRKRLALALLAIAVLSAACSRTGNVTGEIVATTPSGGEQRAAHLTVLAVPGTESFERDWRAAVAAFEEELAPARQGRDEAAQALETARLTWTKAVGNTPAGGRRSHGVLVSARHRELWAAVRAAERRLAAAESRMREIGRRHDPLGVAVVERHAAQRIETDAMGHYVFAGLPAGLVYLYTRLTVAKQPVLWFRSVTVRPGIAHLDLIHANAGGWPFLW